MAEERSQNGRYTDPTENVKALSEAANLRQDDLRKAESRRIDELRQAESRRVNEQLELRAEYAERLAIAEAKRIDAIRAVDVNAVAVASQRAGDQATVLASQVVQSADALRSLVATTAAAAQQARQQDMVSLSARLTALEQSQYEGKGKQLVTDPQLDKVTQMVEKLASAQSVGSGKTAGINWVFVVIVAAVGFVATLISIAAALYAVLSK